MGLVYQHVRLADAAPPAPDANALADSGAADRCIPGPVARQVQPLPHPARPAIPGAMAVGAVHARKDDE